jgi:hypothetical protein
MEIMLTGSRILGFLTYIGYIRKLKGRVVDDASSLFELVYGFRPGHEQLSTRRDKFPNG